MTLDVGNPRDRRMVLRYNGRCRLCEASLAAGTYAIYEPAGRTVRCVACTTAPSSHAPEPSEPVVTTTPRAFEGELRLRAPASAVIAETMRIQSTVPPRTRSARLFGRSPLSADSLSWYLGALGELEVARVLDRLGLEWSVIHAIPVGTAGSDIDHLVIGPAGVFTINSKFHEGLSVWVGSRRLLVNGQRTDHLRNASFEARRVSKVLTEAREQQVPVTPVIAIVAARRITVKERPADVVVVTSNRLVRRLTTSSTTITPDEVDLLRRIVINPTTWGSASVPEADLVGFAALREDVTRARRRRRVWALAALLGPFVVLLAGIASVIR